MLFALFFLVNLALMIVFFYVLYRAVILVRKEVGLWAAVILVLGIGLKSPKTSTNEAKKFEFNNDIIIKDGREGYKSLILANDWLNDIHLNVSYVFDKTNNRYFPKHANSHILGLTTSNYIWTPQLVILNPTNKPNRFAYVVDGSIRWRIWGISTYTEIKTYKGFFDF